LQGSPGKEMMIIYQSQLLAYILTCITIKPELPAIIKGCIEEATEKPNIKRRKKEKDWAFLPSNKL